MKTGIKNSLMALGFFGILATSAQAAYFDYAPAPRCDVQIVRNLYTGSEGVDVTVLQDFLRRIGLLSAVPNGHYGPATTAAVRAFQYQNGIPATGTVGPMTRNAINERICDPNPTINTFADDYSYGYYGGASGVTVVDPHDPFVKVITPPVTTPNVYTSPQSTIQTSVHTAPIVSPTSPSTPVTTPASTIPPATTQIASTNIIYSPSLGYTYGITPVPGTLTVTSPVARTAYNEGDTVNVTWTTSNLNANGFTVLLENTSTGQSKVVTTTNANSVSFTLTRELLDAVCASSCTSYSFGTIYENQYRIVVSTPMRDIAGTISNFRAVISPITIKRPITYFGSVSLTTSKTPVNSGELFKLYVNIPTGASWNANVYGQYRFTIRAACPSGVTVSIAGVPCGSDFALPFTPNALQQEIPVIAGNSTWFRHDVTFTLTVTTLQGQVIATDDAVVSVNGSPFSW